MAEKYPARLYDAQGMHVADIESDEDLTAATARENVVEAGGKTYIWNQRNGQWRPATGTVKIGRVEKVGAAAPAETPKAETK